MTKIIAFDGPTACGKTTLLNRVDLELNGRGFRVDTLNERNVIRNLINKLQMGNIIRSDLPPLTESLFWTMNQAYRVESELAVKHGDVVLIDRYIYTPIIYQYIILREQGTSLEKVIEYIAKPFGIPLPVPDLTLILTAPLEVLKVRFQEREGRPMGVNEIDLTKQAISIYSQLRERFKNCYTLDSSKTIDELYKKTEQLIKKIKII